MDAEIIIPSVEDTEVSKGLLLKPAVGQSIAAHASLAARDCACLIVCISRSFFQILFPLDFVKTYS